jgi:hypothetical protein
MRVFRLIAYLGLAGSLWIPAEADELNVWPLVVARPAAAGAPPAASWQGGGPLCFSQPSADGGTAGGCRPLYIYRRDLTNGTTESDLLYPLLIHRATATDHRWSLLSLVNFAGPNDPGAPGVRHFDVWPVYFSRVTGNAATSYHAVFPLHGTVLDRFGDDRISWTLFPLYARFEHRQVTTTAAPWPFIKILRGDGHHGFAFWPVFGWRAKAGVYRSRFFLWPLIYRSETNLSAATPDASEGVLPFYARDQGPGYRSETYLWPFFGYTHRAAPYHYDETRWFWPLLVQGRGDDRRINRWAPFYTHSVIKGDDKRWVLWPLFRQERWTDAGLVQTKTQLLYFVYWSLRERSATQPKLASAQKTHCWPLWSYWDNGAGHRQLQLLSPLEVFFPNNEPVRLAYSPLFALYRYEQRAPGDVRWSFLWDAITWRQAPAQREFHLGPLFGVARAPDHGRIALVCGLIGLKRGRVGSGWKPFLFDFSSNPDKKAPSAASP